MSHTPEPWKATVHNDHIARIWGGEKEICKLPLADTPIRHVSTGFSPGYDVPANAARIVACVNGCAGLNPSAYRACVEAAEEAKRQVLRWEQGEPVTKQNLNELFQTLREALNATKAD